MKARATCLWVLALLCCTAGVSLAHRANIFAFVDGDAVQVECFFSKSQKVRNGRLVVSDLETGAVLLEGVTDAQGLFRFRPDAAFLGSGHGLNLLLQAGEGHQGDWQISAGELRSLAPPVPATSTSGVAAAAVSTVDAAELEAVLGRVLDAKLAPLKRALARQEDSGPGLRDIVGGLGWILGLLGLASYLKYRR